MHIQMKDEITITAPVSKVWKVLGEEFGDIAQWATIIVKSNAIKNIENEEVVGRVCSAKGFGDTEEELTHYDDNSMSFSYNAVKGLPFFIKTAENNWSVHSVSESETIVKSRAEIEMNFFPGFILAPLFKLMMGGKGREMFEELKFYIENDQPHPRKRKQLLHASKDV